MSRFHCLLCGNEPRDSKKFNKMTEHTLFVYAYHTRFGKSNAPLINIKIAYDTAIANLGSIVNLTRGAFE